MIYVMWASTGRWPTDRTERPVGVFTDRKTAVEAAKLAQGAAPRCQGETTVVSVFELQSIDRLCLNGGTEVEWDE